MKVTIGTPMYGGMCHGTFLVTLFELNRLLVENGHDMNMEFIYNESLIQRARNDIASRFLDDPDSDVLLFIDADIQFNPQEIYEMLLEDKDVIGAVVPLKGINWMNVKLASLVDYEPKDIPHFAGYHNVNVDITDPSIQEKVLQHKPFPAERIGAAVMSIKKEVLKEMSNHVESYGWNLPTAAIERKIYNFFPVEVVDGNLMSEDFSFCNKAREIGFEVYATAYPLIGHTGSHTFYGNLGYELTLKNKIDELQKR